MDTLLEKVKANLILIRHNSKLGGHTKIMVGGGPVTNEWAMANGADGYSDDSIGAVKLAHQLMGLTV
ncbi:MAG: hypothetical protein KH319_08145 [Butyricicoccus pullicaecorum]|nr:hypothetical protein [Butyricicoccus pullicaecorum]